MTNNQDPDGIYWEEFVERYKEAKDRGEKSIWERADIAAEVETTYGGADLMRFSQSVTESFNTLLSYRWVAKTYPKEDRNEAVSFRHHQVLAANDDRLEWLKKAAENKWSVATLQAELRPSRTDRQQKAVEDLSQPKAPDEYTLREIMLLDIEDRHRILAEANWETDTSEIEGYELYPDAIKLSEAVGVLNYEMVHNKETLQSMNMLEFLNTIFQRVGVLEYSETDDLFYATEGVTVEG